MFAKRERRYPNYRDALPDFASWKSIRRIIVTSIAGDHCHFMAIAGQPTSQIGEVLRRGDDIRIEALVEQKNSQISLNDGQSVKSPAPRAELFALALGP